MAPWFGFDAGCTSSSTQHDQIIPPEHRSMGFPPPRMQEMDKPHSNFFPLNLHVCGITAEYKILQTFINTQNNYFRQFHLHGKESDRHRSQHTTTTEEIQRNFVLLPNISIIELGSNWFDELDCEYFLLNASKSKISCSCLEAPSLLATSICMATTNSDKTTVHVSTDTGGYAMMVHFNFFLFFIIHHSSALVTYWSRFLLGRPQAQHTL